MAYDKGLSHRINELIEELPGFSEKKMFGGICFLLNGNMACGILGDEAIIRVGKDKYKDSLKSEFTREFDFTGRPMTGWVVVFGEAIDDDEKLSEWVDMGVNFALSLPPKIRKIKKPKSNKKNGKRD